MDTPKISEADAAAFKRDGAIVLRRFLSAGWIDVVLAGIEEVRACPSHLASCSSASSEYSLFFADIYAAMHSDSIRKFIFDSPASSIVAQILGSNSCQYVLDQVFYKDIGLVAPSHWHQDTPYFNFSGYDMARFWVSCDPAPREVSLRIVRGSHLWNVIYRPETPEESRNELSKDISKYSDSRLFDTNLPSIPNINNYLDSFDILEWDVEPGDVVVFHPSVIHGAGGDINVRTKRRAIGVLFAGDKARYKMRRGYTVPDLSRIKGIKINDGDLLSDYPDIFPKILPKVDLE